MLNIDNVYPTADYVIFRRDSTGGQIGLIIIPDTQYHDSWFGTVLRVGPKVKELKPGDRIIVSQHDRDTLDQEQQDIQYCRESQILCVMEPLCQS